MQENATRCVIDIDAGSEAADEERVALARRLRSELRKLGDIEDIQSPVAAAPPGSKSSGIDLQTIIITLAASGGVLTTLIASVQSWVSRRERVSVTLEIGGGQAHNNGCLFRCGTSVSR